MNKLVALPLIASLTLGAPALGHAAGPRSTTYKVTYTIDFSHDESDAPGVAHTLHGIAVTHMHEDWTGTHYACRFDTIHMTLTVNGQVLQKNLPGSACNSNRGSDSVFKSIDFSRFPDHPRNRWSDAQTMTVSDALQWPIDKTVALLLSPVSWHTDYASDGRTFVTSHGTGSMLEDRAVLNGRAHLHAHLIGSSGMSAHVQKVGQQYLPLEMTMRQGAKIFMQINNTATGVTVTEHDQSQFTATMGPA